MQLAKINLFLVSLILSLYIQFNLGHCKTIPSDTRLENFVDFTEDGDQLAIESSRSVSESAKSKSSTKREILGQKESQLKVEPKGCSNVKRVTYPVIPVIIASLIGLIGSIIISGIIRLIYKHKREDEYDGYGIDYDYDRRYGAPGSLRRSAYDLMGVNLNNTNFSRILKHVLAAIDKVY